MNAKHYFMRKGNRYRPNRVAKRALRKKLSKQCWHSLERLEPRVLLSSTYLISDLGVLDNTDSSTAVDINNSGIVVGTSSRTGLVPQSRAVRWDAGGTIEDLGTLGGTDAWARAINDNGQITGIALDVDGKQDGFRFDPGVGMFDIGGLGTNAGVYPTDININGDVVGGSFYFGMQVGFLYTDADGIQINTPATTTAARTTTAINDNGDVAVFSSARSWITGTGGGWIDGAYPTALNNSLVATGSSDPFGHGGELFRYTPGVGSETLGQLSLGLHTIGSDVNESGVIVGRGDLSSGSTHALIYTDSDGMIDLNHLISPNEGWVLTSANGLNDGGSIVGGGFVGGQQHAFLLTPFSGADAEVPLATLEGTPVSVGNDAAITFSLAYWDRSGVDVGSLGDTDLTVTAPDGSSLAATFVSVDAGNPLRPVATYSVNPSVGVLGVKDNGTWAVAVNAAEVVDTNGDAVVAGEIGTFDVAINHEVTAAVSGPAIAQASIAETFTLTASTTWSYDAAEVFDFAIDWNGDGTVDQTVAGQSGTTVEHTFDSAADYTIRVVAGDAHGASSLEGTTDITVTAVPGYQVWEFAPALSGTYRSGAAGVNLGGTLYLLGGAPYDNGGEEGSVNSLAPGATSWTQENHLDEGNPISDVGAGVDSQGRLIYFGGKLGGVTSVNTYEYSGEKGDQLASKSFAVTDFAFAADGNGLLYSVGGDNSIGVPTTGVERYDGDTDSWTTMATLPEARTNATAVYDGAGHVLVIGGVNSAGVRQSTVFTYDIATDTWSTAESLPEAVTEGAAALGTDGLVYFTGGLTSTGESDRVYIYNPVSGSWRDGPVMPTPRRDHAVAVGDDGFLYVMGGASTNLVEKIDINATSQAPLAVDDDIITVEDQVITFDVRDNDTDADGDPMTVTSINTSGTVGSVVINPDGTLTYTPAADYNGIDTFTYRVSDPGGQLDEATVTVTVQSDGITAGVDSAATDEDTLISLPIADLLVNDSTSNAGGVLSVDAADSLSSQGAAVTLNADGTVTYDPSVSSLLQRMGAGDVVVDTFGYTLTDGSGSGDTGVVYVTITGVNDAPVAGDDLAVVGYRIDTIDYPGATSTSIVGMNNLGVVVGTYADTTGSRIFTYDGTTFDQIDDEMYALAAAQGITASLTPRGINDAGVIVGGIAGTSNVGGFTGAEGFVYDGVSLLPVAYGGRDSSLADVNNNGLAVGSWANPASHGQTTSVGFTYDNGVVGSFQHPDHTYLRGTWLSDVNDAGVMVGGYYPSFYSSAHGFAYDGTSYTDVLFPGTTWGYTNGINNLGTIIGTQIRANGADRYGFVFDAGTYESFQYPGWSGWTTLDDINDAGELSGSAAGHGFIARPATSADKGAVFVGRALSTLANDTDVDFNDSLATLVETVTSSQGATVRILSDGRFEYDPTGSAELQALIDGDSLVDTFTYTLVDSQGGSDAGTVSITVLGAGDAGSPPTAALINGGVTPGGADHTFSVRYTDDTGVDVASIDSADIRVTGPNGYDVAATLVSVDDPTDGTPRIATYNIAAPGGSWDGADNGTYTITTQPGQVLDVDGNPAGAVPLGTFTVAIDAVPTLTVSGTTFAIAGENVALTLDATSSFPSDPGDVFTFDLDWENDGTYEERISGVTGTQANHIYTTDGTYTVGVRVIDKNLQSVTATHSVEVTGYWRAEVGPAFGFNRTGASAVNQDGTIYVLGGTPYSPDGAMDARADYLPLGGEAWVQGPYLDGNISRQGAGIDALNRIIVFGGFELGHGQAGGSYVYDPVVGATDGIAPRTYENTYSDTPWGLASATDDQGYVYAAGGAPILSPGGSSTVFERYNAATDTWELLADLPEGRTNAAAVYDGAGHILVIGGERSQTYGATDTIFTYDIASGTWLDDVYDQRYFMPKLPVGLNGAQAAVGSDGLVYITGGSTTASNYSGSSSTTYVLDPNTRALVAGPTLNDSYAYHSSELGDDGYVYVIGGYGTGAVDKLNTFAAAAPEYLSDPQQYAVVGEAYDAGAFFKGNPRPSYTLVGGPTGMTVDAQTGVLIWTPTIDQVGPQSVTLAATNEFGTTEATFTIDTLALPPDVHAPTTPTNLQQTDGGLDSITFTWDAATDDRGVDHYKMYKWVRVNRFRQYWGVAADNIVGTSFTLSPANSGRYRISAVDAAGNEGALSAEISAALYTVPNLSHFATNANEFIYAIDGDGLYVGDSSQSFTPAPYAIYDSGNPKATLSVLSGPAGVAVDSATGIVSWVPTTSDIGTQTITIHGDNPVGSADFTFTVDVHPAGTDLIRPTTIYTPTATETTHDGGTITWTPATDNVGVVGQRVYGRLVGTTTSFIVADLPAADTSYTITSCDPNTQYMLWVSAYDAAGNEGPHAGDVYPLFLTTLADPNNPPTAFDDTYDATEDAAIVVDALSGVLLNDTDADGDPLAAALVSGPTNGAVTFNLDGSFTYQPAADFNGVDSFTYTASDGPSTSNTATVTINVAPVNDAPGAGWDTYWLDEDTALVTTTADGLFANDFDIDGDAFTMTQLTAPSNGTVVLNSDGTFSYTPDADFVGNDQFTYQINDGQVDSNVARVTFVVWNVNDAPVATDDAYSVDEDVALNVSTALGILANDNDVDGDILTPVLITGPSNGALTLNADGSFAYTPNPNFNGSDSFTYRVNDALVDSNTGTVSISVNSINDASAAGDDTYTVDEGVTLNVPAPGLLSNDTDADGDPITAVLVTGPSNGALTLNADGSFDYIPNVDFYGADSFTYDATDGLASNTGTVSITVSPINDAPVASDGAYSVDEDTPLNVSVSAGVLSNDTDADGDALSAVLTAGPTNGSLVLNADGSFTYTPDAGFSGTDSFSYVANDGLANSNTATVSITVAPVNDAPVGVDDAYTVDEGAVLNVAASGVLSNDTDADGDALSAVLTAGPTNGSLVLNADGSFTYTPDAGFNGTDSFSYVANDGTANSNTATVSITVNPITPLSGTQFFVVDDGVDDTFEYGPDGTLVTNYDLAPTNTKPRGAAANPDGSKIWVIDNPEDGVGNVYVYDNKGGALGSWSLEAGIKFDGIATDGFDIWIVDRESREVFYYSNGAARTSGSAATDSSFALAKANKKAAGITTDGQYLWVVDNGRSKDKVFKYTVSGTLLGSWTIDSANASPTGITIDPTGADDSIWIVDNGTHQVFQYTGARDRESRSQVADAVFNLDASDTDPQGIADPLVPDLGTTTTTSSTIEQATPTDGDGTPISSTKGNRAQAKALSAQASWWLVQNHGDWLLQRQTRLRERSRILDHESWRLIPLDDHDIVDSK